MCCLSKRGHAPEAVKASPSSRGLGHRPFTAITGVRIPLGTPFLFWGSASPAPLLNGAVWRRMLVALPVVRCSLLPSHSYRPKCTERFDRDWQKLGNRKKRKWSGKRGSNPRPSAWEADALPTELLPLTPTEMSSTEDGSPLAILFYRFGEFPFEPRCLSKSPRA